MKLKNKLKGDKDKKPAKKQQPKQEVEQKNNFDDEEQQRDDALIDIQEDLKKKQDHKPKTKNRVETNKLQEVEIDVSKLVIEQKKEQKKPITSWIVQQKNVSSLLQKDFKLNQVDHQFESLTDTKLNQQLKQKKQQKKKEQKTQTIGQMKFAPINAEGSPMDNKNTDKITFSKPKTQSSSIGFSSFTTSPAINFTNSKLNENVQVAPLQKPQLYDDDIQQKMKERMEQRAKVSEPQIVGKGKGGNWFKKNQPVKQAPKIQFKSSPLAFTNSALKTQPEQVEIKMQPLQKSKQEQKFQRQQQEFKFTNKKEVQERRKKKQEELVLLQQKEQKV